MSSQNQSLNQFQHNFLESVLTDTPDDITLSDITPESHLRIYRNNIRITLTQILRDTYPVIERLVGAGFFRFMAREYIRLHPPASGNMNHMGETLPHFLTTFEPVAHLPYLPDIAQLEWARHHAWHADTHPIISPKELAAIPESHYNHLHFMLHPSCTLLHSRYPAHTIWQANRNESADASPQQAEISLDAGESFLCIYRQHADIHVWPIPKEAYIFLCAIEKGDGFTAAIEQIAAHSSSCDIPVLLSELVGRHIIVDWKLVTP